jgi:hypothetical protein
MLWLSEIVEKTALELILEIVMEIKHINFAKVLKNYTKKYIKLYLWKFHVKC